MLVCFTDMEQILDTDAPFRHFMQVRGNCGMLPQAKMSKGRLVREEAILLASLGVTVKAPPGAPPSSCRKVPLDEYAAHWLSRRRQTSPPSDWIAL